MKTPRISPDWLNDSGLQNILRALEDAGHKAFVVGGCVRDALLELPCNDVDIATDAHPAAVSMVMQDIGASVYETGIDHGTLTVKLGATVVEITTFRHDVATDGRRATIRFAETMEEDCFRRDFTMNALYADMWGEVYDPTGAGVKDLANRVVRFVGDANQRCIEDYLRILRFFRFHARFGQGDMCEIALQAIRDHKEGLNNISGERKWMEIRKILSLPNPLDAMEKMKHTGVLRLVTGDIFASIPALRRVIKAEQHLRSKPSWKLRFHAISPNAFNNFPISNEERRYFNAMNMANAESPFKSLRVLTYTYGTEVAIDCWFLDNSFKKNSDMTELSISDIAAGTREMPVRGQDLLDAGIPKGRMIGEILRTCEAEWLRSDLSAGKPWLLQVAGNTFLNLCGSQNLGRDVERALDKRAADLYDN